MDEVSFGGGPHMNGVEGLDSRPGLAIPGYFVHVLLSPVVLLLDALDSNHGNSILVAPLAIAGLELRSLLEKLLVPSAYH